MLLIVKVGSQFPNELPYSGLAPVNYEGCQTSWLYHRLTDRMSSKHLSSWLRSWTRSLRGLTSRRPTTCCGTDCGSLPKSLFQRRLNCNMDTPSPSPSSLAEFGRESWR